MCETSFRASGHDLPESENSYVVINSRVQCMSMDSNFSLFIGFTIAEDYQGQS